MSGGRSGSCFAQGESRGMPVKKKNPVCPRAIVIAASTGGLQALHAVLSNIGSWISSTSIFVVLHLPEGFASIVASHLQHIACAPTFESANNAIALPGHIYVARSGKHLHLKSCKSQIVMRHLDTDPLNFCKPAADILFASAAETFGASNLGVVLSGMGVDGLQGSRAIVAKGGTVFAQDIASSVIWGMPGAVIRAELASVVGTPEQLSLHIRSRLQKAERNVA